jgi:hypothetical protein
MPPVLVAAVLINVVAMNTVMIVTAINKVKASTEGAAFFERGCNTVVWQRGHGTEEGSVVKVAKVRRSARGWRVGVGIREWAQASSTQATVGKRRLTPTVTPT